MEEKCNIPLYSTSGLMHIVRYVFIRKTHGGSRQAVALGFFSIFNCQAMTCKPRDFSPHSTTFMWVLIFFFVPFFPPLPKNNALFKKGWKMCETQFKALSITLTWPMLPREEKPVAIKVLSIQWQCWTYSYSHYSTIISHFFQGPWSPLHIHCVIIFSSLF